MLNTKTLASQGKQEQRAHMGPGTLIINQLRNNTNTTQIAFVHGETGAMYPVRVHGGPAGYRARQNVLNSEGPVNAVVQPGGFVYEVTESGKWEIGEVLSFSGGFDRGGKLQPYSLVATNARSPRRSTILNRYISRLVQARAAANTGEEAEVAAYEGLIDFLAEGFPNDFEKTEEGVVAISEAGRFVESEIAAELGVEAEFDSEDEVLSEEDAAVEEAYELDA